MNKNIVFSVLNAKYVHASPAPYCLASGVRVYAPSLYPLVRVKESTVNRDITELLNEILKEKPRFAGFTCYIWNIVKTLELCRVLKERSPQTVIALGGPEAGERSRELLEGCPFIDLVFRGEGEESVPEFLGLLYEGQGFLPPEAALLSVGGLCLRTSDGGVRVDAPRACAVRAPSPLSSGYAEALGGRIAYIESSRNCPFSCAYCLSGQSKKPFFFEGEDVFENILTLARHASTVKFIDRTFNAGVSHADRILSFILEHYGKEIPSGVTFHFEIAADILRPSTMELLSGMPVGAVQLEIGIQSFNPRTLEAVRRKTDLDALCQNVRALVEMGNMHIHTDLIAGLPHEGLESFRESFNKAYALGANMLQLGFLKVLHGSYIRDNPSLYPCEFESEPPYRVLSTPWLSADELTLLELTENALDKIHNSGRFSLTLDYMFQNCSLTPFDFYMQAGLEAERSGLSGSACLDTFTRFFYDFCVRLTGEECGALRECFICDRLATDNTGHLPDFLFTDHENHRRVLKLLGKKENYPECKGVRRGFSLLSGGERLVFADYRESERDRISRRYPLIYLETASLK